MAETSGVVSFTDSDGRTVWAGEGSKAHKEHLKSKAERPAVSQRDSAPAPSPRLTSEVPAEPVSRPGKPKV